MVQAAQPATIKCCRDIVYPSTARLAGFPTHATALAADKSDLTHKLTWTPPMNRTGKAAPALFPDCFVAFADWLRSHGSYPAFAGWRRADLSKKATPPGSKCTVPAAPLSHPGPSNSQMENTQQGPCQRARQCLTPTRSLKGRVVLHWSYGPQAASNMR
jgi:hypothetical protein